MTPDRTTSPTYVPTSVHLSRLLDHADTTDVTVAWLIEQLGTRSFGLILFVLAIIGFIPGASMLVGVLIAWPAFQMILGHDASVLPRLIARRSVSVNRLSRVIQFTSHRLKWVERLVRPRWPTPFQTTKRLTGFVMLLLGFTMISPIPFSQYVPALVIMLLALAYLEEDGVALLVALIAALSSLTVTAATVWGVVETADWLDPVRLRMEGEN